MKKEKENYVGKDYITLHKVEYNFKNKTRRSVTKVKVYKDFLDKAETRDLTSRTELYIEGRLSLTVKENYRQIYYLTSVMNGDYEFDSDVLRSIRVSKYRDPSTALTRILYPEIYQEMDY